VALNQKSALRKVAALENSICRILEQDGRGDISCFSPEII